MGNIYNLKKKNSSNNSEIASTPLIPIAVNVITTGLPSNIEQIEEEIVSLEEKKKHKQNLENLVTLIETKINNEIYNLPDEIKVELSINKVLSVPVYTYLLFKKNIDVNNNPYYKIIWIIKETNNPNSKTLYARTFYETNYNKYTIVKNIIHYKNGINGKYVIGAMLQIIYNEELYIDTYNECFTNNYKTLNNIDNYFADCSKFSVIIPKKNLCIKCNGYTKNESKCYFCDLIIQSNY